MDQQQTQLRVSLSTKLLLSVVFLLVAVIAFLNLTTMIILRSDKISYTYQMQATEAQLVAKDFSFLSTNGLQTLRSTLGALDPRQNVGNSQRNAIENLIHNQTTLMSVEYKLVPKESGMVTTLATAALGAELKRLGLIPTEFEIPDDVLKAALPYLIERQFAFINLSTGGKPLLGILLADVGLKDYSRGVPVVVGVASLGRLMTNSHTSDISVIDASGSILFDTDPQRLFGRMNLRSDPLFEAARKSAVETGALQFDSPDPFLGSYMKTPVGVTVLARTPWQVAQRATTDLMGKFILLGLMAVGLAVILALIFSKSLTAPLNRLYEATKEIGAGNFNLNLKAASSDEIGILSSSFNIMSEKIQELIQESMEKVKIEGELAIASTVQQTLFPPPLVEGKRFLIHSYYTPASQVGGDWWGYIETENRLIVMVADATGHGFPSALITAAARSCFSVIERLVHEYPGLIESPRNLLSIANRSIFESSKGEIMMTFFIGVIDFNKKEMVYASAGHNPPWYFQKTQEGYVPQSLLSRGPRLGEDKDCQDFEENKISIANDDVLFMYTDGVLEGTSSTGDAFGKRRARAVFENALKMDRDTAVQTLADEFLKFNEGKPLDDDVTIAATIMRSLD